MWWLSLAIFAVVVVVVAVLLGLILAAAKSVDRHAAAIWIEGKQIAGNTVSLWMLQKTNQRLGSLRDSLGSLARSAEAIAAGLGGPGEAPTRRR